MSKAKKIVQTLSNSTWKKVVQVLKTLEIDRALRYQSDDHSLPVKSCITVWVKKPQHEVRGENNTLLFERTLLQENADTLYGLSRNTELILDAYRTL